MWKALKLPNSIGYWKFLLPVLLRDTVPSSQSSVIQQLTVACSLNLGTWCIIRNLNFSHCNRLGPNLCVVGICYIFLYASLSLPGVMGPWLDGGESFVLSASDQGDLRVEHMTRLKQWGGGILFPTSTSIVYSDEHSTHMRSMGLIPGLVCLLRDVGFPRLLWHKDWNYWVSCTAWTGYQPRGNRIVIYTWDIV